MGEVDRVAGFAESDKWPTVQEPRDDGVVTGGTKDDNRDTRGEAEIVIQFAYGHPIRRVKHGNTGDANEQKRPPHRPFQPTGGAILQEHIKLSNQAAQYEFTDAQIGRKVHEPAEIGILRAALERRDHAISLLRPSVDLIAVIENGGDQRNPNYTPEQGRNIPISA